MTGTYFWFILSLLSGLNFKKWLRPVRSSAITSPSHSNILKIIYSAAVWYSDWSILSVQTSPHEELNRSVTLTGFSLPLGVESSSVLLFKSQDPPAGTKLQIRIPGPSLSGVGQPAVRWCRWWDSQVEFRIVLDHLCLIFLKSEMYIHKCVQCTL